MWRASVMCDATITAEGRDFLAHKVVLVGGSEFFYGAFTSGLAESDSAHVSLLSRGGPRTALHWHVLCHRG